MASKVAVVFGAGQGFGYQVARKYAQEGYKVALVARTQTKLEALAKRVNTEVPNSTVLPFVADVSDLAQVNSVSQTLLKTFGFVDAIFIGLTPGPTMVTAAAKLTVETAKQNVDLLYYSTIAIVQNFLPSMQEKKQGSIVIGTGIAVLNPKGGMSGPMPAASAQRQYALTLNQELAPSNIFVGIVVVAGIIHGSALGEQVLGPDPKNTKPPGVPMVESSVLGDSVFEITQTKEKERIVQGQL